MFNKKNLKEMAIVRPISLIKSFSGKMNKAENQVFYVKFGKNYVWENKGVHSFNANQVAVQTVFSQAATQANTIMASTTQKATYMASFKAQSKYKTFRGYLMAQLIDQINNAGED